MLARPGDGAAPAETILHRHQLLCHCLPVVEGRHGLLPLDGRALWLRRWPRDFPRLECPRFAERRPRTCNFPSDLPQVPTGIRHLTNLVSLDLSTDVYLLDQHHQGYMIVFRGRSFLLSDSLLNSEQRFETFIAKLTNLRELKLGSVDLSNSGTQWCVSLARSCPKLEVLSLPFCQLSGSICSSLSSLQSLVVIDLRYNSLSGPIPEILTNFSNLRVLQLGYNKLQGSIPSIIFSHKKIMTIDLYNNPEISGYLPNFSTDNSLENLDVGKTNFSGIIPTSISNLTHLKKLGLGASGFLGDLPSTIANIKYLSSLQISGMGIVGSIPPWITNLTSLTTLQFYDCGLSGSIPSSIGYLRNMKNLVFSNCSFSGKIPPQISNLTQLRILVLYSNHFMSTVLELTSFIRKLPHLIALDLSHNNLVVVDGEENSSLASLPKLAKLDLAGCKISKFPNFLKHQDKITGLGLSYNQIHGAVPKWVWTTSKYYSYFTLANNTLTSIGYSSFLPLHIGILVLRNNMFEGPLPIPQGYAIFLDYSYNRFSSVPSDFRSHLNDVFLFEASGNNLSGELLSSFCGLTSIQILDLSYNNLNGTIPSCLIENATELQSLNLYKNQLHGKFPDSIKENCSLEALDLSDNMIEGQLPRSLAACKKLEVLDFGNNQITDSFPCWMSTLSRLQVLVLKFNKFTGQVAQSPTEDKGACTFPSATIMDLSSNNFTGTLPQNQWFKSLRSMIFRDPDMPLVMDHEVANVVSTYKYTTEITYKGHDTTFTQISTALVFIDFSSNAFHGSIPEGIGELILLQGLNISHNSLTGQIPSHINHLSQLETLDLSSNNLSGGIPQGLASLDFLTILNISNNELEGRVPHSPHFLTFSNGSFIGNQGLCGPPLSKECINTTTPNVVPHRPENKYVDVVLFIFAGLGFGIGFSVAIVVIWGFPK
ncbi:unnamed protein product [Urochloa decumbens]|uniref:Disease resistance R13L4/SHOC-2-like LRR domain-containing protein n=1 Tax=Urochloa decumbens TaxID=240449 RepID=A0ABC8ZBE4_9POAL